MQSQLSTYLRAGYPGLAVVSSEDAIAKAEITAACAALDRHLHTWSATEGLIDVKDGWVTACPDPIDALQVTAGLFSQPHPRQVVLLRDLRLGLDPFDPLLTHRVRDLLPVAKAHGHALILLGGRLKLPAELEHEIARVDFLLPDAARLASALDCIIRSAKLNGVPAAVKEAALRGVLGLTTAEAENAFAMAVVEAGWLDPRVIFREKYRTLNANGRVAATLSGKAIDPSGDDCGGLVTKHDSTGAVPSRSAERWGWQIVARLGAAQGGEPAMATGPSWGGPAADGSAYPCDRSPIRADFQKPTEGSFSASRSHYIVAVPGGDIPDVPDDSLAAVRFRIKQAEASGQPYFDSAGAAADLAPYGFPAYFLEQEAVQFAVPVWPDTRPFQQLPFQFSLHVLTANATLRHHAFLDLSGDDPSRHCAESLIAHCGLEGPVFVYKVDVARRVMCELAARFPALAAGLEAIVARLADLEPIVKARYYHPDQHGSWNLKAVLPAAVPDLSYDDLDGVANNGMAVAAYQDASDPATPPERKRELEAQLHAYCHHETLGLVRLWQLFSGGYANPGAQSQCVPLP
jgi:hypothetical protein